MSYNINPFLERRSEKTTSDQEFALVFSPKILEKLPSGVFGGGVHIFRSAPGGGKTTLLRAFTPSVLKSFWAAKGSQDLKESFPLFVSRGVIDERSGPQLLGVMITCASGYADLPPGASTARDGSFRALLDCRVILRTIRSLSSYLGINGTESLDSITLEYPTNAHDFQSIPAVGSAGELAEWAEGREKKIYAQLDDFAGSASNNLPASHQFESINWLESVKFRWNGKLVAENRLLMIDDLHRLRRRQRELLVDELTVQRPGFPIWLAMRTLVLGDALLSQGARIGRDITDSSLEKMWGDAQGFRQFLPFAQNVLDRRMKRQLTVTGAFSQSLREQLAPEEIAAIQDRAIAVFRDTIGNHKGNIRYSEWIARAEVRSAETSFEMLLELFVTRILIVRDASNPQMAFDMALSPDEIDAKDTSSLRGAAEIQLREEADLPYFYGLERLCVMSTFNIEELLSMAAALYDGIVERQILRKPDAVLSPAEQEKIVCKVATNRLDSVPKMHTEGTRAKSLLSSIGGYCRKKTFLPNAPYAPGVTGVRLSNSEMEQLQSDKTLGEQGKVLRRVLSECVAENLLVLKHSSASSSREEGSIFYLNRALCAKFGLPLQMGGWQDVKCLDLIGWMERGWKPEKERLI